MHHLDLSGRGGTAKAGYRRPEPPSRACHTARLSDGSKTRVSVSDRATQRVGVQDHWNQSIQELNEHSRSRAPRALAVENGVQFAKWSLFDADSLAFDQRLLRAPLAANADLLDQLVRHRLGAGRTAEQPRHVRRRARAEHSVLAAV